MAAYGVSEEVATVNREESPEVTDGGKGEYAIVTFEAEKVFVAEGIDYDD